MYKKVLFFAVTMALATHTLADEKGKLKKWVDKEGVTHYGDVIPPEYADRSSVQLKGGKEVKKKEPVNPKAPDKPVEKTPEQIEQDRRDKALLGSYSSVDEIDQARDRNLQQLDAQGNTIQAQIQSLQKDKQRLEEEASKKPGDKSVQNDLKMVNDLIVKRRDEQARVMASKEKTKADFERDRQRYIDLTSGNK